MTIPIDSHSAISERPQNVLKAIQPPTKSFILFGLSWPGMHEIGKLDIFCKFEEKTPLLAIIEQIKFTF